MHRLVVSNIAWATEEESAVAKCLQELGVKNIEIAPTKIWEDPIKASDREIKDYLDFWQGYGVEVVSFQSMLFSRPDLKLFEDSKNREQTKKYLVEFIKLAGRMGAKVMVFGSPKNRQKKDMDTVVADKIAQGFFNELGDAAKANNTIFCIEPNPVDYACDHITNAAQGLKLVKEVNNSGFGLHLDIAGMTLARDNIAQSIEAASSALKHFHISSPYLGQVENSTVDHDTAAKALKSINYPGYVSIEMRPGESGQNSGRVKRAVLFAQETYGKYLD